MKKNKLLVAISSLLIIYGIIGFIALPKILKPQIEKVINENITEQSSLEKIEFNPFLLKLSIHNFKIFNEKETTISVEKLLIDFSLFKSIDEQHISFKDLELVNPYINIIENNDGSINLQKLAKEKNNDTLKKEEDTSSSDIKFQVYKTILDNAKIKFTKLSKDNEPFTLNIDKLNYTFYDMGTYRNTLASHTLKILINKNSELEIKGGVRLAPFKMHGNVELKNFKPNDFLTYKKDMLNFDLNNDTYLDMQFGYKVDASKELKLEINDAHLNLRNLDLKQDEKSILSLKHLDIDSLNLNYPENKVSIDTIFLNKLNSKVISDKNNTINFSTLVKSNENVSIKKENIKKATNDESTDKKINKSQEVLEKENKLQKEETNNDKWEVIVKKLNIKDSTVSFSDLKNKLLVDTNNINIDLSNFKLNANNVYLDKFTLSKPNIDIKDNKNKLNITNKELLLNIDGIKLKDSALDIDNISLLNNELIFKDIKNNLDVLTQNINININALSQDNDNLKIKKVTLNTPKINFKDNKNKMIVFTKESDIIVSDINKVENNISVSKISVKNPSIYFNDNKNNLTVVTNSLAFNTEDLNINNSDLSIKKTNLKTENIKFDDKKSKLNVTSKNINIIATNTSLVKEKLKVAILSLTKPTIYLTDDKNETSIIAKKLSLKINDITNYKNALSISKINLYEPDLIFKDKKNKTDILAKNLYLNIQKISHKNNKLKILRSSLNKPYVSITLGKQDKKVEKTTNKEEIVKISEKTVKKKKSSFVFDIGPFKINNAKMTFEDKNLPIPFKTNMTKLNGEFSRLNSSSSKPTKLKLEGAVDEYGYTKITGTVDINDIKLLTDTNLLFKNIAIKNFTPYSGKFVGREIESGKLNLDLKYNIKKSDLNAQNSIIISDIKLGKNVKSPDAVNLPLELAIALLEDTEGVIDLNLPVAGNVDDPQFSIAPIVWKVFTNLIVKAITSPFRLLASAFGLKEEDIKSLEFEFGKDEILTSEKESLDNIAKILSKKPKLAIKVKQAYHKQKDKIAMQDIKFEKFLEKKMKKIVQGDEYKEALEDLYKDIDGAKKLNDIEKQFTKLNKNKKEEFDTTAYVEYLRKTLASKQKVEVNELELLAKKRAENIVNYLTKTKKTSPSAVVLETDIIIQEAEKLKWVTFDLDVSVKK